MKVILSIGIGRLHLLNTAHSVASNGVELSLICGWVPKKADGVLVRIASHIVGRNLIPGMQKRVIPSPPYSIKSCAFAECCDQAFRLTCRLLRIQSHVASAFAWKIFGWQSKKYLKDGAEIFHVRSGAGQGGAITRARKLGMKILVDHSALHPSQSEENLKADCERWRVPVPITPRNDVWKNVLKDCEQADIIMVNAEHIKDSFVKYGYDPRRIRVVYLGVRKDFWGIKRNYGGNGCYRVLFTGGFILLKGAEYILESLKILVGHNLNVHYDVVGTIGAPAELLRKYDGLPITYHGQVPQDDLKDYLSAADCYIFPSLADGCAQSGMEALAAGLPVVATRQSGLPITDGVTGCIVPIRNALAISNKIQWLMTHREEAEQMGRNAVAMIKSNYSWEQYAENVKKIYMEMLNNG